jgi:hypothetical protein
MMQAEISAEMIYTSNIGMLKYKLARNSVDVSRLTNSTGSGDARAPRGQELMD